MQSSDASSVISLPKGGGALSGLGEKFSPHLQTGTGNFSVPISIPPGRNGFQPQLNLGYSTGNGNGPFGLGWSVDIPGIARKTSQGIPRYDEGGAADDRHKDVFLLSGSEDLVPVSGQYPGRVNYRPRTEGLYARIEHVRDGANNFWEVRTKDGLVSRYGRNAAVSRDPGSENPDRIFSWRLTETCDAFGNLIAYDYLRDAGEEQGHRWDQPILQRIKYADYGDRAAPSFLIQVEFVYERRPDPFSEYRAGFEIRTTLRCHKILIRTHTADGVTHGVQEYRLRYEQDRHNGMSLLAAIELFGFDDAGVISEKPVEAPLTYGYSRFDPAKRKFKPLTGAALPVQSLSDSDLELVDLHGNGLPDFIEMNGAVRYWRNLGSGQFAWPQTVAHAPPHRLSDAGVHLIDANGDGRADLLVTTAPVVGHYPMTYAPAWDRKSFQRYAQAPTVSLEDAEVKLLDLDGDGITDVLRSGSSFECYFNDPDPRQAWQRTVVVERRALAQFPNVNLSDERIRLADLTGDGLQDIVAIHDGSVEYWPNLGHGRWGCRISMRRSPRFPHGSNARHILLGDVDGDGLADLVYVDHGRVFLWLNQSGNGWSSEPIVISGTPPLASTDTIRLIDLEGTGVSGLLWSRNANGSTRDHLRFLDFTGGRKPYLLNRIDNNRGAETLVEYRPSTRDYLRDYQNSKTRWQTPLPFPVQVVARVETIDRLSRGKLTTEYRYHHGYWDGAEREFRGFGMVEQLDSETFEGYNAPGLHGPDAGFDDFTAAHRQQQFSPPTLTKNWFHLGPVEEESGAWQEPDYRSEFWPGDHSALSRPASMTEALDRLPRRARRDALCTLRGQVLRTELYALDDTERADRPYTVHEYISGVREDAPLSAEELTRRRIFFPFALAQRTTQWERGEEPKTQLSFFGDHDAYGQPRKQMTVAVPRGRDYRTPGDSAEPYLATALETLHAQRDTPQQYMIDRVARIATYELINGGRETPFQLWERLQAHQVTLRPIGLELRYYDGEPFEGLPFQELGTYGAVARSESLLLTTEILREVSRTSDGPSVAPNLPPYLDPNGPPAWTAEYPDEFREQLPPLAGYVYRDGGAGSPYLAGYYTTADRRRYDFQTPGREGRGVVIVTRDPLGRDSAIDYDAHDLLPVQVADPVGLTIAAHYNYRVLQPDSVTDRNGNTARVTFTSAGLVSATYIQGKNGEGDRTRARTNREYDRLAFMERAQPVSVRTIRQIHHDTETDVPEPKRSETIEYVEYSDGFGRILQTRTQAEDILFGDPAFGGSGLPADLDVAPGETVGRRRQPDEPPNVVVSGWQVYDNKGRVVEKYEPFYAKGWEYETANAAQFGAKATTFYDPLGQVVRTLDADGSEQRVIYGIPADLSHPEQFAPTPWEAYTYDANDLAPLSKAPDGPSLINSAPANHHFTPASIVIDALGRTTEAVTRNTLDPSAWFRTRSTYDIRGNPLSVTDALDRLAFRYTYDLANRPWRSESLDAGIRRSVLDVLGSEIERRDSKGALILHAYDLLGRPIRLWARDAAASSITLRQRIEYGDAGTPDQPASERAEMRSRNLLGQVHRHHDEAGLTTVVMVDFKGNALETSRRVIADAPILAVFDDAAAQGWEITPFQVDWDPGPQQTLSEREAELLEETLYETTASVDALNRIKWTQFPQDVEGQRRELRPEYNRAGGLEKVRLDDTLYVERIAYNAKGQKALIAYGNGVMIRYAYDPRSFRLKRLRSERYLQPDDLTYESGGETLQDFGYEYDLVGNILAIGDRAPSSGVRNNPEAATVNDPVLAQLLVSGNALNRRFDYDAIYRLLSATGRECDRPPSGPPWQDEPRCTDLTLARAYTEHYSYDPAGNMFRLHHRNGAGGFTRQFAIEAASNRLLRVQGSNGYDYTFDANGNMRSEATSRHFEWDPSDRMNTFRTQASGAEPSVYAHYLYDAVGQRVKKLIRKQGGQIEVTHCINGQFEHHRWGGQSQGGDNNHLHVMDDKHRIALVRVGRAQPRDRGPAVQFHLGDHLGSSTVVVDREGALVNREEFTPYGETSFGSFARKRYRFTGKERDEESGLSYHGARYYAPGLARWTSSDPAGITGGLNTYTYVLASPLCLNDPSGLEADTLEWEADDGFYKWPGPGETIDVLTPEEATLVEYTSGANLPGGGNPRDPKSRSLYNPLLTEEQWRAKYPRAEEDDTSVAHVYDFSIPTEPVDWLAAEDPETTQLIAQAAAKAPSAAYVAYRRGVAGKLKSDVNRVNTAANVGKAAGVVGAVGAAVFGGGLAFGAESVSSGVSFAGAGSGAAGAAAGLGPLRGRLQAIIERLPAARRQWRDFITTTQADIPATDRFLTYKGIVYPVSPQIVHDLEIAFDELVVLYVARNGGTVAEARALLMRLSGFKPFE